MEVKKHRQRGARRSKAKQKCQRRTSADENVERTDGEEREYGTVEMIECRGLYGNDRNEEKAEVSDSI